MLKLSSQKGVTIPELLIAIFIGTIILATIVSVYSINIRASNESMDRIRLDQELFLAMNVMSNQIRRAGFWSNAQTDIHQEGNNNPFMTGDDDVKLGDNNNCITFTYDYGLTGSITDADRFGYRVKNGVLQQYIQGGDFSCDNDSSWADLTDPNLISVIPTNADSGAFWLEQNQVGLAGGQNIEVRTVNISLTGYLNNQDEIKRNLTQEVRIRNDKYVD